jgi:hypothetical protein
MTASIVSGDNKRDEELRIDTVGSDRNGFGSGVQTLLEQHDADNGQRPDNDGNQKCHVWNSSCKGVLTASGSENSG